MSYCLSNFPVLFLYTLAVWPKLMDVLYCILLLLLLSPIHYYIARAIRKVIIDMSLMFQVSPSSVSLTVDNETWTSETPARGASRHLDVSEMVYLGVEETKRSRLRSQGLIDHSLRVCGGCWLCVFVAFFTRFSSALSLSRLSSLECKCIFYAQAVSVVSYGKGQ